MEQGWIYVLVNSSMPGLAKVGRTTKPPQDRAAELSGATGVATPFVLAFDQAFADCCAAERAIHAELERRGLRVSANREFFRGSVSEVVRVVLDAADAPGQPAPRSHAAPSGRSLLAAGDCYLFGTGDTLQDTGEAVRCYKLAASRGSLIAYDRLGRIFSELYASRCEPSSSRSDRVGRRRALAPLKEGARRGNYYCYAEMATLFAGEGHLANVRKAWELFFTRRAAGPIEEVEAGAERYAAACCRYIGVCLALAVPVGHRDELLVAAHDMRTALLAELDSVGDDEAARRRVTGVLRWVCQELLPDTAPRTARPPRRFALPLRPAWLAASHGLRAARLAASHGLRAEGVRA